MTHINMMENSNLVPPDGKYGWVIVLSYALANVSITKFLCFIVVGQ